MTKHTIHTPAGVPRGRLERLTVQHDDTGTLVDDLAREWVADGWTLILAIPAWTPPYVVTLIFLRPLTRPTQVHMDELWGIQNRRRGELLFKRVTCALTIAERRELDVLETIAEQRLIPIAQRSMSRLRDFPSPPSHIVNIVSPPSP